MASGLLGFLPSSEMGPVQDSNIQCFEICRQEAQCKCYSLDWAALLSRGTSTSSSAGLH